MLRFGAVLVVTALGCSGSPTAAKLVRDGETQFDGGVGGSFSAARGGSNQGGSADIPTQDAGGGDAGNQSHGGTDAGDAGSGETGDAGRQVAEGGQGGSAQGGQGGSSGGSDQGGAAGSDHGGSDQGGSGGGEPTLCVDGYHCDGLTLTVCDGGEEYVSECGTLEDGLYCSETEGCYGECFNGDVRCSGETAEACVDGAWAATEECAFQCVNGACEGACEPGTVLCDGASLVTCGSDLQYGSPVACPTAEFFTATCSGGVCGLEPIACSEGTADCDNNGSCEANLSSTASCGQCGVVCPSAENALPSCNGSCGLSCNDGFTDCDGDASNGCEVATSSDPLNCGSCGNSCYGACTEGACAHDFDVVSDFTAEVQDGYVFEMAVGPAHVYWWTYDHGTNVIRRAPKDGGEFQTLTTFEVDVDGSQDNVLLVDNGQLYWATRDGIYRMAEGGGTPVQLTSFRASSLAIANGKLYWNDSHIVSGSGLCTDIPLQRSSVIQACNGAKVTTFYTLDLTTALRTEWQTTGNEYSPVLGVVDNEVFVTSFHFTGPGISDFTGALVALDATTGAFARLIANGAPFDGRQHGMTGTFGQAVVSETAVLFTSQLRPDQFSGIFGLCRAPLNVAEPHLATTLVTRNVTTSISPDYLAVDATHAYYSAPSGLLTRVTLAAGSSEALFGDTGDNTKVAVDDTHIYWSTQSPAGEWAVLRTQK